MDRSFVRGFGKIHFIFFFIKAPLKFGEFTSLQNYGRFPRGIWKQRKLFWSLRLSLLLPWGHRFTLQLSVKNLILWHHKNLMGIQVFFCRTCCLMEDVREVFKSLVGLKLSSLGWFYGDVQVQDTIYPGTFSSKVVTCPKRNSLSLLGCLLNPPDQSRGHPHKVAVDTYINIIII